MSQKTKIILGIDPGTVIMGYSILSVTGNVMKMVEMDVVKLNGKRDMFERLGMINEVIQALISKYKPDSVAIEAPFFGKNVQSMLKLGRAQGVAIAAAMQFKLPVTEYAPKKVKQSITGNGNADKDMVWKMLERILDLKSQPKYFDATDALGVALCHWYQMSSPVIPTAKGLKGWDAFLAKNPGRLKVK